MPGSITLPDTRAGHRRVVAPLSGYGQPSRWVQLMAWLLPGLARAGDWVRSVLSQHPATTPGTRFAYSSDGSHLLSAPDRAGRSSRQHMCAPPTRPMSEPATPTRPGYGYQWWTMTEQGHRGFAAIGLGGKLVEVIPDLAWSW
jgi:CubicO group peptidase (beta-lactamase class C family)